MSPSLSTFLSLPFRFPGLFAPIAKRVYTAGMKTEEFSFISDDGKSIHIYHWIPQSTPKACIIVAHGLGEHAARYGRFAAALTSAGYEVWAPDHRGHGKTAAEGEIGWLADRDGFRRVVEDLKGLADRIQSEHPGRNCSSSGIPGVRSSHKDSSPSTAACLPAASCRGRPAMEAPSSPQAAPSQVSAVSSRGRGQSQSCFPT
jgi:hypothetical protein